MIEMWTEFILNYAIAGFLVVFVGTMLLFAEVLVRGKLIFGFVGFAFMTLYFTAHMQETQMLWVGVLYIVGVAFVMIDGKFIGDGTVAGIGLVIMLVALALPAPDLLYGLSVAVAFILGGLCSLIFMKFIPRRKAWSQLALKESLSTEKGFTSMNEGYKDLIGKKGVADTRFNPTGQMKIDGKIYSATSEGRWIEKGDRVQVTHVSGARILVQKVDDDA